MNNNITFTESTNSASEDDISSVIVGDRGLKQRQ